MSNKLVNLKDGSDVLYPITTPHGIDTNNKLAEGDKDDSYSYTATQDCNLHIWVGGNGFTVKLNNKNLFSISKSAESYFNICLNKGDTFSFSSGAGSIVYEIFGVKQYHS